DARVTALLDDRHEAECPIRWIALPSVVQMAAGARNWTSQVMCGLGLNAAYAVESLPQQRRSSQSPEKCGDPIAHIAKGLRVVSRANGACERRCSLSQPCVTKEKTETP